MRTLSRMKLRFLLLAVVIVAFLFNTSPVTAQDVATGSATATVATALAVVATSALAFGTVYQGVTKSISRTTATAAVFDFTGQANADLLLYLSLPEFLSTASGDDRVVIAFSTTDATVDTAILAGTGDPTSVAGGFVGVDPHDLGGVAGGGGELCCLGDAGIAAVYLGGKIIPTADQTAGSYTGDIILTVQYVGT